MDKKIKTYRDLNIWNVGIELVKDIYKLTEKFPKQEMYGIVSQMLRKVLRDITIRNIDNSCM